MPWYDDDIAGPMGYKHCVLFDCARDAISAYHKITGYAVGLPENICPELVSHLQGKNLSIVLGEIDQTTGQAQGAVHLYGYQAPAPPWDDPADLSIDPLMTGWVRRLTTPSAIVSFGRKKMLSIGYGGAFLTNDHALAQQTDEKGHWNKFYSGILLHALDKFHETLEKRWEAVHLWDRYLGDSLTRIPGEQLMPWRVMRRVWLRDKLVDVLRRAGHDVGTNYPPLTGVNDWGSSVLNFSCSPDIEKTEIQKACEMIKRVVYG